MQGWEFALSLLPSLLFRFCCSFKKSNARSLLKERLEQNEWITLFTFSNTRATPYLWRSNTLFLRVGFATFWRVNWKLDLKIYNTFWLYFYKKKSELLFFRKAERVNRSCRSFKKIVNHYSHSFKKRVNRSSHSLKKRESLFPLF